MDLTRRSGVLLHPTSLPGPHGIGELGPEAFRFVDWLAEGGQALWQVMPLGPTGYGDSPYQCLSAFAANPMLISMDLLVEHGLLEEDELEPLGKLAGAEVDFGGLIPAKEELLKLAFHRFQLRPEDEWRDEFEDFKQRFGGWLHDYALFKSLKEFHGGKVWSDWPRDIRDREPDAIERAHEELGDRVELQRWLQFVTFRQWWEVRHYAATKGIVIMGDLPLFVAYDSADVWCNRDLFHLDEEGHATVVAGVPPDYFSETGQRWGNPLYNWEAHRAQGYGWWEARFRTTFDLVDWVRIDHFRGLEAYWEIPASEETAVNGRWVKAPGAELLGTLLGRIGDMKVVAEDLGVITDEVVALRKQFNFPGMRVLQFAWGSGPHNEFLPHNYEVDSVVYTGTHDNNTTVGWSKQEMTKAMRAHIREYVGHDPKPVADELIRLAQASTAAVAVIPMQDWLGLGAEARMNTPGQPRGNWTWRLQSEQLTGELSERMLELATRYGRVEEEDEDA